MQALGRVERIEFSRLVEPFHDKLHTVVTFMAGLELAKRRMVAMRQREPFAALWLYRVEDEAEPEMPVGEIEPAEEAVVEEGSGVA